MGCLSGGACWCARAGACEFVCATSSWGEHDSLILKPVVCTAVAMAQGEPAGFGYWIGVLVKETGLALKEEVPRDKRALFRKLARFLVENEFEHVSQLVDGQCMHSFLL